MPSPGVTALSRASRTTPKGNPTVSAARRTLSPRNVLLVTAALCGLLFASAGSAAACSALDALGGVSAGFGNSCSSR